ncbi:SpoIIIAH-like family protein [Rubeoparvulum massiliense]|uniref:SpoIIIAH-like family protein n=1 Tax=Rubeoparvulum massiliense TaxID=1631346 RepID=UPI00065E4A53|nr:SpoIIIAH-like family protein [Rubeoparvulum massiliense]
MNRIKRDRSPRGRNVNLNMKKQTVFLFTMLALMVVLSAYYMLTDDTLPTSSDGNLDEIAGTVNTNGDDINTALTNVSNNDYFDALALEKSIKNAEKLAYYVDIIAADSDAETVAEAKKKMDEIMSMEENQLVLEEIIKSQGYGEVVVMTQDNKVHVVVQSEKDLELMQADQIIGVVAKHFNISGNEIVVYTHP